MSTVHLAPLAGNVRIRALASGLCVQESVERKVGELWAEAVRQRGGALRDGQIFSVVSDSQAAEGDEITGRFVAYRYYMAQRLDASLSTILQVRPLAVAAIVRCADGFVVGRRTQTSTQDPGAWELIPSGGIEPDCLTERGEVDAVAQLRKELREEVGLEVDSQAALVPRWRMLEGAVTDLVFSLDVPLDRAEVATCFSRVPSPEHTAIDFIDATRIAGELTGTRELSCSSRALLGALACDLSAIQETT